MRGTLSPRAFVACLAIGASSLALFGCSSDSPSSTPPSSVPGTAGTTPGSVASNTDPDAQLAQAKTVAVGFFEAQAINDWDKALQRSSGAAALTIKWAQAVNTIKAANNTPYQVPSVTAPNVRVQLDSLEKTSNGLWSAKGFVELSFRPGPVVSTTAPSSTTTTTTAAGTPRATFVVDLLFSGEGDALRLDDYRLDDTPYPVSQLFMSIDPPAQQANGATGQPVLAHRDLDGSVQYVVAASNDGDAGTTFTTSTFTSTGNGSGGTAPGTTVGTAQKGTVFADPLAAGSKASVLVVFPGTFPGSAGILALATAATPGGTTVPGTTPATEMKWTLPDFPALTPRPVNTVNPTSASTTSTSSTSSTSTTSTSSTTTTTAKGATTTVTIPSPPTVTAPTSTATTTPATSTTSSSSTTSTTAAP